MIPSLKGMTMNAQDKQAHEKEISRLTFFAQALEQRVLEESNNNEWKNQLDAVKAEIQRLTFKIKN